MGLVTVPYKNIEDRRKARRKSYYKHREQEITRSKNYQKTKRGKESHKKAKNKYRKTEKGRINHIKHNIKSNAKRRRNLGFNKLIENDWDCDVDWHHVNDNDVVPLPRKLHRMCFTGDRETHRKLANKLVKILYGDLI